MPSLVRFPRGYIRAIQSEGVTNDLKNIESVDCDQQLANLYKLYMGRNVNPESWEFRALVVERCAQLFGNFTNWLWIQLTANDCIYDYNLEFLYDTVTYIRTGRRAMSVATWLEMVLERPEEQHGASNKSRAERFKLSSTAEFNDVISQWCSHPDGFSDMLCTAHLLFGVSKSPITTPV